MNGFLFKYILKCNLFLWCKTKFSAWFLPSSVSHDPLEIITKFFFCWFCCSRNIYYCKWWKWLCCLIIFLWKPWDFFSEFLVNWKVQKNSIYLKYIFFSNNINVFKVAFDQCNASLLKKTINVIKKKNYYTDPKLLNTIIIKQIKWYKFPHKASLPYTTQRVCVFFFGMLFNLMCECAQLFLAIARVPGAYLVLQYATTHTMPTTSSATQMPVIVSTRFWYSSSASEWTRAMDKHTHMHRRTQRQTHMYTTTIEHKDTHTYKTHNRCISGNL